MSGVTITSARWASPDQTSVVAFLTAGSAMALAPGDPRLAGVTIGAFQSTAAPPTVLPVHVFLDNMGPAVASTIAGVAFGNGGNAQLMPLVLRLISQPVDLTSPLLAAGLSAFVAAGALTAQQRATLLAGGKLV
jgi:hypothetical protein